MMCLGKSQSKRWSRTTTNKLAFCRMPVIVDFYKLKLSVPMYARLSLMIPGGNPGPVAR